jgi:hypothetical protein
MNRRIILLLPLLCLFLTGCMNNPFASYKETSDQRLAKIYQGQASSAMEAKNTPDVLYNMEYGLLLRLNQEYAPSNMYFARAQKSMDVWTNSWKSSTAGQIASQFTSLLLNDQIMDYQPKGYERSFLATFYALNHLALNNFDDARIEIKKMYELEQATQNYNDVLYQRQEIASQNEKKDKTTNEIQQQIKAQYNFSDIGSPKILALKNSYQNAFSHYLAGFVFEALKEPSLSRPGYVKSGQLNPTNTLIQKSIDNLDQGKTPREGTTDLLIVEEVGHAPQIQSIQIPININLNLVGKGSCANTINLFFPKLVLDTANQPVYKYLLDTQEMMPLFFVDVNLMAARTLYDGIPHLISRNVAAALRNIVSAQLVCSQQNKMDPRANQLLQMGNGFLGSLMDKSDERILTLLPSKININRVNLPYGKHTITVPLNGASYKKVIMLNQPYQIITFRIMGSQVFFGTQLSMKTAENT